MKSTRLVLALAATAGLALAPALRADQAQPAQPAHGEHAKHATLKLEDLPAAVRKAATDAGHGAAVESVEQKTTKDGATQYVVHFAGKDGKKGHHVTLDATGAVVATPHKKKS